MFLKELYLAGFKSFARAVRLELGPGVTAVVGPNGSGKSNIVDAVRWVLGEQSARALRGARSEDVIFGGSTLRHPLGMAEVTLVLDNAEHRVDLDVAEIAIARRLYRSGETEYLVNHRRTRLRDVVDLAGQVGLGPDSYCVVGQGAVEQLVMQRPQERRLLIADAADIRRYEARLAEIESDLRQTQANAMRVAAVVAEIRPQLDRLRAQAERADRHRTLRDEVQQLAAAWYARAAPAARATIEVAKQRRLELRAAIADSRWRLAAAERRRGEIHDAGLALQARSGTIEGSLRAARASREAVRVERASLAERRKALTRRRDELRVELGALGDRVKAASQALERSTAAVRQGSTEASLAPTIDEGDQTSATDAAVATARRLQAEAQRELERARGQLQRLEREEARLQLAAEGEARVAELTNLIAGAEQGLAAAQSRIREIDHEHHRVRADHHRLADAVGSAESAFNKARRTLDGLLGEERAVAAFANPEERARAATRLSSRLAAPARYRDAVAAALGEAAVFQVVDAVDTAWFVDPELEAVEEAVIAPGRGPRDADLSSFRLWVDSTLEGHMPYWYAVDILDDTADRSLAARYLGDTIIVGTLAEAQAAASRLIEARKDGKAQHAGLAPRPFRVATEDGQCLRSGGERVLHPAVGQPMDLRSRQAQLGEAIQKAERALQDVEGARALAREREGSARRALFAIEEERQLAAAAVGQCETTLRDLRADLNREEERLSRLSSPGGKLGNPAGFEGIAEQRAATMGLIDEATRLVRSRDGQVLAAERQRIASVERRAALDSQRALAAERMARLRDAMERDSRELEHLADRDRSLRAEAARMESEGGALAAQMEQLDLRVAQSEQTVLMLEEEAAGHASAVAAHGVAVETLGAELQELQSRLADLRAAEAEAGVEVERAQGTLARLEVEVSAVAETIAVEPAALLAAADGSPVAGTAESLDTLDDDLLQRRLARAQRELRSHGAVDYGVLADYSAHKDRCAYLTEQLDDLAQAEAAIREAMGEVRQRMEVQFAATFREVNNRFVDAFRQLFGGGQAELLLSGDPSSAECGIDIVAQPPGKRLHRLGTLSGGERALVGAALLLALIGANPSPFCMLDEVDAALDDANVQRFAAAIREMAHQTQFILITHNRATMEMADALYGVTMTPGAVSQVVATRLPT